MTQIVSIFLLLGLSAYRIVPLNKIGSWRMIDSLDLNVCKGSLAISIPSMIILPIQKKMECLLDSSELDMAHFQLAIHYSRNRP